MPAELLRDINHTISSFGMSHPFSFSVARADGKIIPSGDLDVSVNFMGTPIFQTQWDLCAQAECPIHPGDVKIHYTQNLPPVAPPVCSFCQYSTLL
jgi:hypothetical protein